MNKLKNLYVFEDEDGYHLRLENSNDWWREIVIRKGEYMDDVSVQLRHFVEGIEKDIEYGN